MSEIARRVCESSGKTLKEASIHAGLSASYLGLLHRAKIQPSLEVLTKLSLTYELPTSYLIGEQSPDTAKPVSLDHALRSVAHHLRLFFDSAAEESRIAFADDAGISTQVITDLTAMRGNPRLNTLQRISEKTGLTISVLIGETLMAEHLAQRCSKQLAQKGALGKLSSRIRTLIEERNEDSIALSKHLGLSAQYLKRLLQQRASPDLDKLMRLAQHFDVTLDYLLGHQDRGAASKLSIDDALAHLTTFIDEIKASRSIGFRTMARETGISAGTLNAVFNRHVVVSLKTLDALSRTYGRTISEMIGEHPVRNRSASSIGTSGAT